MADLLDRVTWALEGRYRVVKEVGRGGMAVVFEAEDLKHRRPVAIKVMLPEIAQGLGSTRFLREIEIAASLAHPNILPLHDSGEADGLLFFVMPYIRGESLRGRLERDGSLPLDDVVRIVTEVGDALEHAHALGIVHRDIKPENILFQADHAVVSDFGIAKAVSDSAGGSLTETGLALGTLRYMSPEQATGEPDVDVRSDVYSLGCVAYEMLAGASPFVGRSPQALLARKVTEEAPPLPDARGDVPPTARDVLRRALARDPSDRFQSVRDFTSTLRRAVTAEVVAEDARRRRRSRIGRAAAAILAIGLLATGAWWGMARLARPAIQLVAVLPLENASNDPGEDFFAAGAHRDLIQELSRADVRVISPTSVMQYKDTDRPASEISRELGVDAVIEGSTSLIGDSVMLDLRLTNGATDELMWFDSFGAHLGDVLGVYARATREIADQIGLRLTPAVEAALESAPQVSPDVYRALLQGRFFESQLTQESLTTALDYYQLALNRDPDNSAALAGIASAWGARAQMGFASAEEAATHSEPALERALSIDSTLADVQYTLATRRTWGAWNWQAGEQSFQQLLASDPTHSVGRAYYSQLLHFLGRDDEAREQIRRAAREDPFNPQVQTIYGMDLTYVHDYQAADSVLLSALSRSPDYRMALTTLRSNDHLMGRYDDALDMWRASNARDPEALSALDRGYARAGYQGALQDLAELLIARSDTMHVTPWQIGTLYTRSGDADLALDYLERAFEEHDPNVPYLSVDPIFDFIRDEPRFEALIERLGLPERRGHS